MIPESFKIITGVTAYNCTKESNGSPDQHSETVNPENTFPIPFLNIGKIKHKVYQITYEQRPKNQSDYPGKIQVLEFFTYFSRIIYNVHF